METFMEPIITITQFVTRAALHMLPFFMASVVIAAAINTSGFAKKHLQRFMGRNKITMILMASLLGTLSPFCSCGVIPIISGLLIAGAPISPILAFWISSPLMDPETFVITSGGLGLKMAIFRLASAFLIGVTAGLIGLFFERERHLKPSILNPEKSKEQSCSCGCKMPESKTRQFLGNVRTSTIYLGKWLLLAFVLEAVIINYIPMDWIGTILGKESPFGILLASLIGLPIYVNGISAVPIVKGLMSNGMSQGAAMAFLISGPVTTIPAMVAVTAVAKKKLFAAYILIGLFGALIAGYLCQLIL